jgi:hypothetical protein
MNWIKYSDKKPRLHKLILGYYNDGPEIIVLYGSKTDKEYPFRVNDCGTYYKAPDYWIYIKDIDSPHQ